VSDREIDEILKQAAQAPDVVDPALLDRIARSIKPSLRPVRPLLPAWLLAGGMILICAAIALGAAAIAGFHGIQNLSVLDRAFIFPLLGILISLAANACVSQMIPGSRHRVAPGALLGISSLALLSVFTILFRDYRMDRFFPAGIACLLTGLLLAIPTALLGWFLLRRGFAVDPIAAGLAGGTLAGLAGVTMLELHCANFQAPHILLWHTAVLPISAAAGAFLGWALYARHVSSSSQADPGRS
jgi:hypothetical protein